MRTRPIQGAFERLAFLAAGTLLFSCTWGERSGGDKRPYKILGRVTHAGAGLEGVTVLFQGEGAPPAVVTGADGSYEQTDFSAGSFTVVASHGDYEFFPPSATVDASTNPTVDFEAVPAGSSLQLWSPNGGEVFLSGQTVTIIWNSIGSPGATVQLDYWDDSAGQWINIAVGVPNADGANGCDWLVPEEAIDPGPVRVRVVSEEYPAVLRDESDGWFTVEGIAVLSPDGGETWYYEGDARDTTWVAVGTAGNVEIHYSTDGGLTYPDLVATVPASDGSYAWLIPNEASAQCRVRVQEPGGGGFIDESDADFTIAPATVAVVTPAGGESWDANSLQTISWSSAGFANVRVELSRDGGGTWEDIVASTPAAAGTYSWTVTGPASTDCVVRVSHAADGVPAAASPAFTIQEPLALTIAPDTAVESAGTLAGAAVVSVPTPVAADLVVGLSSDDETELTVPASVTILAGNTSAAFDLTVVDDAFMDGDQVVSITATGTGFTPGSDTMTVQDDDPPFTDVSAGLPGVQWCSLVWGDYDNDGDLDLALAGSANTSRIAKVYHNDGGLFADIGSALMGVEDCSLAWGDYDNDGDLDLALAGYYYDGSDHYVTIVYGNDGGGVFTGIGAGLTGVRYCSLAWGDQDNDGDLDLALAGGWNGSTEIGLVYRNDGGGVFADIGAGLTGVRNCSLAWGDYDNDGDLDLALAGNSDTGRICKVYRNDGGGVFADIAAGLAGANYCSLAWGDYDNDGDLDLALAGNSDTGYISKVYRNDGGGVFVDIGAGLLAVQSCSLAWGDYDNDGDLDLALAGNTAGDWHSGVYRNDGGGTFVDIGASLTNVAWCSLAWGDYDVDGDLDLALAGWTGSIRIGKIYRNNVGVFNTAPAAPGGLSATESGGDVTFSWNAADDAETPQAGLCYNLRVGTTSDGDEILSGMADASTGWRRIPALGNAQKVLSWTIKGLAPDTYYWSVQAIDTAFAGSPWPPEETVTVP